MSYNISENSNLYSNTSSGTGNVDIKVSEIVSIAGLSGTTTLSGNDILYLDCDLGARVKVDEARYYFSSASVSGTVASGIAFYYKDDRADSYSLLNTNIGSDYYYTTIPGLSAPRYLRTVHTISGTSVSGTVTGFSVLNEDDTVDFGDDGTATIFDAETAVFGGTYDIKTIPIYNDGPVKAAAYVTIEPQGTNADKIVTISTTSDGPWYGVSENAQIIADEDSWDEDGNLSNLEIENGLLQLPSQEHEGTYTTKVFNNDSKNSFIYLDIYSELGSSFATKDENREVRTIEIRSTGQKPEDYALCRTFNYVDSGGHRYLYYIDYYRDDGSTVYTSGNLGDGSSTSYSYYVRCAKIDQETDVTAGFSYRTKYNSTWKQLRVFTISGHGSYSDYVIVQQDSAPNISNDCYGVEWDADGGSWYSLYSSYSRSGYTIDQGAGYYLIHFNANFSGVSYKGYTTYQLPWDMSCVYSTGKLWYTDRNTGFVRLITATGSEEVQYSDYNQLYGISAASDGGCWYVSGSDLVQLGSDGTYIQTLEDVGSSSLRRVAVDGDDAIYIIDGDYVKRISIDGTLDFSVFISGADRFTQVTDTGVWVSTTGSKIRFVDKSEQSLKSTNISYSYLPAAVEYEYNSTGRGHHIPIGSDTHWQNLEWQEVRPDKYPLALGDEYHQARITLRSDELSDDTPKIQNIYLQKSIEIPNIYPNTAKNAYLKLSIPTQDLGWVGSYNTNLKAWWEIPTNI